MKTGSFLNLASNISAALDNGQPVVALESAVITHGLPFPDNFNLALELEEIVRQQGALPATIAVLDGKIRIGLTRDEISRLASESTARKISRRDFGIALARKEVGGTTVAGTLFAASQAGIKVFATGGIGGVHRGAPFDISADLHELGRTPLVVVCSGAKAILDLPATLEVLETNGVPVIGYQTDDFPAFYSRTSGLKVTARCDTPQEIADIAQAQWKAGVKSAVLVGNPIPVEDAIPQEEIEALIDQAVLEAHNQGIHGPGVTPFLMARMNQLSAGKSVKANLSLLRSNARLAASIAAALSASQSLVSI